MVSLNICIEENQVNGGTWLYCDPYNYNAYFNHYCKANTYYLNRFIIGIKSDNMSDRRDALIWRQDLLLRCSDNSKKINCNV